MEEEPDDFEINAYFPTANKKRKRDKRDQSPEEEATTSRKKSKRNSSVSESANKSRSKASSLLPSSNERDDVPILHQQPLRKPEDSELKALEMAGFKIKRGRFSAEENDQIRKNFNEYVEAYGGDYAKLFGVGRTGKAERQRENQGNGFYAKLAHGLPDRHVWYVYLHARKICHPGWLGSKRKRFTPEETKQMLTLRLLNGASDAIIAETLNRTPQSISEHLVRVTSKKKKGPFTLEDILKLVMCVSEAHGITNFNEARRLLWRRIDWKAVDKLMQDRPKDACKDAWMHIVLPDCIAPSRAQLYFLCSLIRTCETGDINEIPWNQFAQDVGLLDGYVAQKYFQSRKFFLLLKKDPEIDVAAVPLRKAAKMMMKLLKKMKRNKSMRRFNMIDYDDVQDIPGLCSRHNMSWENVVFL